MAVDSLSRFALLTLLISLRIAPLFAAAPPFSLIPIPSLFRVFFAVGVSAVLVASGQSGDQLVDAEIGTIVSAAMHEFFVGLIFMLGFQLAYGAIYVAGRTIDIQAGYGMAMLIDPTTRNQTPLVGTLFALAAGAVFFALDGHIEVLKLFAASLQVAPVGGGTINPSLGTLISFISTVFVTAFGIAGGTVTGLFLADIAIALLSRTTPQLNVLVLGFQVKTLLLFFLLPTAFGATGALFARLAAQTLQLIPKLVR